MKIGYDAKRAVNNFTGLGNYSRLVISQVATLPDRPELILYTPKMKDNPLLDPIKSLPNVRFAFPPPSGFQGSLWRTFGLTNSLRPDGCEIYHGLSNELPLNIRRSGVPSVVTIHDLIYRRLPQCYNAVDRILYDFKYGRSCRNADKIVAISECTKRDIVELYGIEPEKIEVIYQGCDDSFRRPVSKERLEEVRKKYRLPDRYVIQVGTIEWRKNLALTVEALPSLPEDVELVVIGRDRKGYKYDCLDVAKRGGVADRIHWLGSVDFRDLPALYRLAAVAAYPSRYEGYGIPVIEALCCGVPVVGAIGSTLEEAARSFYNDIPAESVKNIPESLFVNPESAAEMAEALNAVLDGKVEDFKAPMVASVQPYRLMEIYRSLV